MALVVVEDDSDVRLNPVVFEIVSVGEAVSVTAVIEFAVSPRIIKRLDIDDSVLALLRYKIR